MPSARTSTLAVLVAVGVLALLVALTLAAALDRPGDDRSPSSDGRLSDSSAETRAFVRAVAVDRPTAHLRGAVDLVTGTRPGRLVGDVGWARGPDGTLVPRLSGRGHLVFPSSPAYSVGPTGELSVELWVRPSALQFRADTRGGYVHLAQKGDPGAYEWDARMYSRRNPENRPNRLSGYAFSPRGGLGAGSYVEDPVRGGRWIHLVLVVQDRPGRGAAARTVRLYKDGVLRDVDRLGSYDVRPQPGPGHLRLGGGPRATGRFQGTIGDVIFYHRALTPEQVRAHRRAMLR